MQQINKRESPNNRNYRTLNATKKVSSCNSTTRTSQSTSLRSTTIHLKYIESNPNDCSENKLLKL